MRAKNDVKRNWAVRGLKIVLMMIVGLAITGGLVMYLWNWLLPPLLGVHPVSFVQALGVLLLSRILCGGFRGRGGAWRNKLRERRP